MAIPIYYATKSKGKALLLATVSGLSEPVGAVICYGLTELFGVELTGNSPAFPLVLAAVAGIMIYISLDELLPTAACKRVFPVNIEQGPTIVSQPSSCVAQCHLVCHSIT